MAVNYDALINQINAEQAKQEQAAKPMPYWKSRQLQNETS